jgi:superfamily II DNA/RNA helicase
MDVLIGTPNTIRDAIKNKHLNLAHCQLVVLDEADQLLDMGRSATNVVGNAVASAVVAKWEGETLRK